MRPTTQIALAAIVLATGLTVFSQARAANIHEVMAPLLAPPAGDQAEKTLTTAIDKARELPPASAFVLTNRLRLQLGGHYLENGNYDKARATLRQIDLDSPAAVSASLLLAESYRLQGDDQEAIQWFLRAAKQYPSDPVTLSGLISAAHEFEQGGAPAAAQTLYQQAAGQARDALRQLDALASQPVMEPAQVLLPSPLLDEPVRKTLLALILQDPAQDLLGSSRTLRDSMNKLLVLQQQNTTLARQLDLLARQLQDYQQQKQTLDASYQQGQAQLQTLTQQIKPNDFSQAQLDIRHAVTQLRNQLQRQQTTLAFIDRASGQLPAIIRRVGAQQAAQGDRLHHLIAANRDAIAATLNKAVTHYQARLKDIAGQAMLDEGKMLERLSAQAREQQ